jgi:PAS domain S-box-containing protein
LRQETANIPLLYRLNIHRRLALSFIFVIVMMLVGIGVLLWQLHLIRAQVERLNGVNEELIEVLHVHTGLLSVYERLGVLARSEDSARLLKESVTLRAGLLDDAKRTLRVFNHLPPEVKVDQTVLPTLESIERTLPSHLDAIKALAASGEWEAVRIRIERQVQPLEALSSELVKDVAREVEQQRAQAALNISRAERRIFLAVTITGFVTLLMAAGLGVAITRSITEPLGRLVEGSRALARGEFRHQVPVIGQDELAQLGQVFNATAGRLENLYETLRKSEANLAEAQRLSHSGSWALDVSAKRLFWSEETFRIFGLDPTTTTPTRDIFLQCIHPDDRASLVDVETERFKGNDGEYSYRIVLSDDSIKYVRSVGHPVTNDAGRVVEFVGTVIDVTEQQNARIALEKACVEIKTLKDQLYQENIVLREEIDKVSMFEEIVGNSPALEAVIARVSKVAPTDSTVLVTGETGTGKELIARAIHKRSRRSACAFVTVNCGALSTALVESELFGHFKGAFTGAIANREGRFKVADGGTILLDEVGDLPPETQVKLLRVLQEHEFEPIGSNKTVKVNVRILAATNRNLEEDVRTGKFRSDLWYRLNVFPIHIPPLRERRQDIPMLVAFLVETFAQKLGKSVTQVVEGTMRRLVEYSWPGNIRELQNVIERAVILSPGNLLVLDREWLSTACLDGGQVISLTGDAASAPTAFGAADSIASGAPSSSSASSAASPSLREAERRHIEAAVAATNWVIEGDKGAARMLDIHPNTLRSRMKKLNIQRPCETPADAASAYGGTSSS